MTLRFSRNINNRYQLYENKKNSCRSSVTATRRLFREIFPQSGTLRTLFPLTVLLFWRIKHDLAHYRINSFEEVENWLQNCIEKFFEMRFEVANFVIRPKKTDQISIYQVSIYIIFQKFCYIMCLYDFSSGNF